MSLEYRSPLYVSPDVLRPLPLSMRNMSCFICDRRASTWEHTTEGLSTKKGKPVCSKCWLYASEWSEGKRGDIDLIIHDVEIAKGAIYPKHNDGRLQLCASADAILFGIVIESRENFQREVVKQTRRMLEGTTDE